MMFSYGSRLYPDAELDKSNMGMGTRVFCASDCQTAAAVDPAAAQDQHASAADPGQLPPPTSLMRLPRTRRNSCLRCFYPVSPQQVNMPYVMIPAFHPNTQALPVTSEAQMTLPLQPIPCKPGENTDTLCYDPRTRFHRGQRPPSLGPRTQ